MLASGSRLPYSPCLGTVAAGEVQGFKLFLGPVSHCSACCFQVPINSSLVYSSPIMHHVQLEDLLPNQTYTYSVGDGGGNTSQALEFVTTGLQPPTSTVRCEQQQAEPLQPPCRIELRMLLLC